ncbi:hypothetical protein ATCV1_z041R [Acanthocystis turfacea chlorella virus 1]|uniref:Uncharacterized protein z041R n=1 Tax=Chlorovirus heliozoae TaxID=322019 RepID=A7K801_9PHYC|nr:hypothetical protein ATCV1_z041R [Acanthocystis turfacea chlorella virus 1]ABT16175.1 hypothetical protein ATCV1_z041R [Acanthocystis turfacea chlorella virus 1]
MQQSTGEISTLSLPAGHALGFPRVGKGAGSTTRHRGSSSRLSEWSASATLGMCSSRTHMFCRKCRIFRSWLASSMHLGTIVGGTRVIRTTFA